MKFFRDYLVSRSLQTHLFLRVKQSRCSPTNGTTSTRRRNSDAVRLRQSRTLHSVVATWFRLVPYETNSDAWSLIVHVGPIGPRCAFVGIYLAVDSAYWTSKTAASQTKSSVAQDGTSSNHRADGKVLTILTVADRSTGLVARIAVHRHAFVLLARFVQAGQANPRPADASFRAVTGIGLAGILAGAAAKLHLGGRQLGALGQAGGRKSEAQFATDRYVMRRTVAGQGRRT